MSVTVKEHGKPLIIVFQELEYYQRKKITILDIVRQV